MQRLDPVGITIQDKNGKAVFVPDPAGVIQTNGTIFFANETSNALNVTLDGNAFVSVPANDQSNAIAVSVTWMGKPRVASGK